MEKFKIYIDRLKNGHVEKFKETVPSDFLDVEEEELSFPKSLEVNGEAYLADDHLVTHFSVHTSVKIPCSICNESVEIPISIQNAYSTISLEEIPSAIYDLTPEIREMTLLQIPLYTECQQGKCPERDQIKKFLHKDDPSPSSTVHFPFADLDKQ
jgi:uncharacterized metal-binding protein YceD (DUF177 family)